MMVNPSKILKFLQEQIANVNDEGKAQIYYDRDGSTLQQLNAASRDFSPRGNPTDCDDDAPSPIGEEID